MKHKCQGKIQFGVGSCSREGTIEEDGSWYCWQHSNIKIAEKTKIQKRKNDLEKSKLHAKITKRHQDADKLELYPKLIDVMRKILGGNECRDLILSCLNDADRIENYNAISGLEPWQV